MASYKSTPVNLLKSAESVYARLSDLQGLGDAIRNVPADQIPEDQRAMLDGIQISGDSITIPGGPTGSITLRKGNCTEPSMVSYEGVGTPVPVALKANIESAGTDACSVVVEADITVPAMLKPMLNGPMQKMVDQVARSLTQLRLS